MDNRYLSERKNCGMFSNNNFHRAFDTKSKPNSCTKKTGIRNNRINLDHPLFLQLTLISLCIYLLSIPLKDPLKYIFDLHLTFNKSAHQTRSLLWRINTDIHAVLTISQHNLKPTVDYGVQHSSLSNASLSSHFSPLQEFSGESP